MLAVDRRILRMHQAGNRIFELAPVDDDPGVHGEEIVLASVVSAIAPCPNPPPPPAASLRRHYPRGYSSFGVAQDYCLVDFCLVTRTR
jgi:hypothetical protein